MDLGHFNLRFQTQQTHAHTLHTLHTHRYNAPLLLVVNTHNHPSHPSPPIIPTASLSPSLYLFLSLSHLSIHQRHLILLLHHRHDLASWTLAPPIVISCNPDISPRFAASYARTFLPFFLWLNTRVLIPLPLHDLDVCDVSRIIAFPLLTRLSARPITNSPGQLGCASSTTLLLNLIDCWFTGALHPARLLRSSGE